MPIAEKEFVIKHVITDVSSMKEDEDVFSELEEHFGVPWKIQAKRNKDHLGLYLHSTKEKNEKEWSIRVWGELTICSVNGKHFSRSSDEVFRNTNESTGWGWNQFLRLDKMKEDYVIDDMLNFEAYVKIKKISGIEKKNLRNFDESNKPFSDAVLVVENQKFHVLKLFLAGQSSYFKSLFLGNFEESKKDEVTLTGISATDFQNFLEILHSEPSINDDTVTGILHLADMYDTKTVIRLCEEFLMEKSEKSEKEKLELAAKYKLEMLKTKCLIGIKTIEDIRSVLPGDLKQMDHDVLISLFQKSVSQP